MRQLVQVCSLALTLLSGCWSRSAGDDWPGGILLPIASAALSCWWENGDSKRASEVLLKTYSLFHMDEQDVVDLRRGEFSDPIGGRGARRGYSRQMKK